MNQEASDDRWYRLAVVWTSGLIVAGILLAIGRDVVPDVLDLASSTGHDRRLVASALLVSTVAAWWAVARHVGPMAASAGVQRWRIWSDPAGWRRRALMTSAPWWVVSAVAVGYTAALAAGPSPWPV